MLTKTFLTSQSAASETFSLLAKEAGPTGLVKHFPNGNMYAQFAEFTFSLSLVPTSEQESQIKLAIHLHDDKNATYCRLMSRISRKLNRISSKDRDEFDPFS